MLKPKMQVFMKAFDELDKNGSGFLDMNEFKQFAKKLHPDANWENMFA